MAGNEKRETGDEEWGTEVEGPLLASRFSLPQQFLVRLHRDRVTVSVDSSGELLHRRGYRQQIGKAPLRETLAAAMLLSSGWDGAGPLVDPFCGSGTIPIEAALLARNIAPGIKRSFAFERWPEFDAAEWGTVKEQAVNGERSTVNGVICGSDRDAGAIAASRANAERAGIAADIDFQEQPLSALRTTGLATNGWLLTNPPYGVRIGEEAKLRDLYASLGSVARERLPGWTVGLLGANPALEGQIGLPLRSHFETENGGITVRFVVGRC
ncbi:MAG: class I SAM-dependent RNA methyltransferase [Gemmatimonadales bacterium]